MSGLARFLAGFKSGFRKERVITKTRPRSVDSGPQLKKSTAIIVICVVVAALVVIPFVSSGPNDRLLTLMAGAVPTLLLIVFILRAHQNRQ